MSQAAMVPGGNLLCVGGPALGDSGGAGHLRTAGREHRRPLYTPLRPQRGRLLFRHVGGRVGTVRALQPGGERAVERGRAGAQPGVHVPGGEAASPRTATPQLARHT